MTVSRALFIAVLLASVSVVVLPAIAEGLAGFQEPGRRVSTLADGGPGSLREAIRLAVPGETIGFEAGLAGGTIVVSNQALVVDRALTLSGADLPRGITLSGGGEHRVLEVRCRTTNDTVVLDSLTVSDGLEEQGAGLLQLGGRLVIRRCLFVDNQAIGRHGGGGALAALDGVLEVANSTFTRNAAPGPGAALLLRAQDHRLTHVTVIHNMANTWEEGHGNVHVAGPLLVVNSILGRNGGPDLTRDERAQVVLRRTLLGQDPRLAPLADYGGPTRCMPPVAGSLAIDAGLSQATVDGPKTDQRGSRRDFDADGNGIAEPDLGAVEMCGTTLVTTLEETGPGSLREAVMFATRGTTVRFAPELSGGSIALSHGPLEITESLTIDASGLPRGILLTAKGRSRVIWVHGLRREIDVVLDSLTIAGGTSLGGAGLMSEEANLVIRRCLFRDNHASGQNGDGGAIQTSGGSLEVENSTFTRNTAMDAGGALFLDGARHRLRHVTIVGNEAGGSGDGIYLMGNLLLLNSIVAGNGTEQVGWSAFPALTEAASLRAGDPRLAPLGDYGGATHTMPPLPGSPAIDAARPQPSFRALDTDQRGKARSVDWDGDGVAQPDIGAVELVPGVAMGRESGTTGENPNP